MNNHGMGMNNMQANFQPNMQGRPPVGLPQMQHQPPALNPMGAPPMLVQNMPPGMPPNMNMMPQQPHQQLAQNVNQHHQQQQFAQNQHHQQIMQSMARNNPPQLNLNMLPVGMGMNPAPMPNPNMQRAQSSGSNVSVAPGQMQGQQPQSHLSPQQPQPMTFPPGFGPPPNANNPQNQQHLLQFQMMQQQQQQQQQQQIQKQQQQQIQKQQESTKEMKKEKRSRSQQIRQSQQQQQMQRQQSRISQEMANQQLMQQQLQQQRDSISREASVPSPEHTLRPSSARPVSAGSITQPIGQANNQTLQMQQQQAQIAMYLQMRQQQQRQQDQEQMQGHHQKQQKPSQSSIQGQQRPQIQPVALNESPPQMNRRKSNASITPQHDLGNALNMNLTNMVGQGKPSSAHGILPQMPSLSQSMTHQMQQQQMQQQMSQQQMQHQQMQQQMNQQLQQQQQQQQLQQQMSMSQLRKSIKASESSNPSKTRMNTDGDSDLRHQINMQGGGSHQSFSRNGNGKIPQNANQPTLPLFKNMTAAKNQGQPAVSSRKPDLNRTEGVRGSSVSSRDSDPHHKLMKPKDARPLIDSLPWEEKIVYLSRHVMGGRKGNGHFRSLAQLKKLRRKVVKEKETKNKKRKLGKNAGDVESISDDVYTSVRPKEELEELKCHPKIAKSMIAEMGLGITFCNTIASTIESILSDIDPEDKAYRGNHGIKKAALKPVVAVAKRRTSIPKQTVNQPTNITASKQAKSVNKQTQIRQQQLHGLQGSMLRKDRDKQKGIMKMKDPIESMIVPDEKKPTKRELAHRHFDTTRYHTLKVGDYVLARPQSQEIWILARIVQDWISPNAPLAELKKMPKVNRDSFFSSPVALQDVADFNPTDISKVKMIERKYVLPLPRTSIEGNEWMYRYRKGFRVYAMYPSTTVLYPATVVDSTSFCQGDDNICVVEFDGEIDERTGKATQRHIPGRFISLVPKEFPISKARKRSNKGRENQKSKDRDNRKSNEAKPSEVRQHAVPVQPQQQQIQKQIEQQNNMPLPIDENDLGSFDLDFDFNDDFGGQRGVSQFSRMPGL